MKLLPLVSFVASPDTAVLDNTDWADVFPPSRASAQRWRSGCLMRLKEAFAYSRSTEYFCSVAVPTVRLKELTQGQRLPLRILALFDALPRVAPVIREKSQFRVQDDSLSLSPRS
jgi:hypothetical protein